MLDKVKGFFKEFETFAIKGNFIDLAVGIMIGTSFNAITNSFVTNIITPPLGLVIGRVNFVDLAIPLGGKASIQYGIFIQAIISFIITALVLFLIVRLINRIRDLAARRAQHGAAAPPAPADSAELCVLKEIRDTLKQQQAAQKGSSRA